jgi:hypothetical protein
MTQGRTRVLSLVGPDRSGTTVLGNILGEVEGITNAGEMRWLWRRGLRERRPCGCGLPPVECPRWSAVLDRVRPELARSTRREDFDAAVSEVMTAQGEVLALRNRLRLLSSVSSRELDWPALNCMRAVTAELCRSLVEVTGAPLIVDTSKLVAVAALLASDDRIDHYVLQVTRDPRAVAFSWQRPKPLPLADGMGTMATLGTSSTVAWWMLASLEAELLRRRIPRDRWMLLKYEDFVQHPKASVDRVLAFLGVSAPGPFVADDTVALGTNHTLAGNPNRFRTGSVRIREDDEWRSRMAQRDRIIIGAAAYPLLLRYGYPLRTGIHGSKLART